MLYRISEVAAMTGLSVGGIRYYEDQGVVTPVHKEGSGYRLYGMAEVSAINRAINYRQMGFSLPESARLANIKSFEEILLELDGRREELERELRERAHLLQTVSERAALIREVSERGELCTLEENTPLFFTPTYLWKGQSLIPLCKKLEASLPPSLLEGLPPLPESSRGGQALYAGLGPDSAPSVYLPLEQLEGSGSGLLSIVGSCVPCDCGTSRVMALESDPRFICLPARRCIYAVLRLEDNGGLFRSHIEHVLRFAREKRLHFCAPAFTRRAIAVQFEGDDPGIIHVQAWFPVD